MKRFTTPHFIFTLPFETSLIKSLKVYFQQNDKLILEKETEHCEMEECDIKLRLTQEETALFDSEKHAKVQLHVLTVDGEAMTSAIYRTDVGECLGSEVIA